MVVEVMVLIILVLLGALVEVLMPVVQQQLVLLIKVLLDEVEHLEVAVKEVVELVQLVVIHQELLVVMVELELHLQ